MKQSPKMPAEKRRAQLLKAAARIFGRKGYMRATTEDIARSAKLSKGALYFHFKNKEDIFLGVIQDHNKANTDAILNILESEKDPLKALETSIRVVIEIHEQFQCINPVLWQQANSIPKIRNYMISQHGLLQEIVVNYLMKNSRLNRKDSQILFMLMYTSLDGMILHHASGLKQFDLENFIQSMLTMVKLFLNKKK